MAITVLCPTCGSTLEVDDSSAGKNVFCPSCAAELIIPESAGAPAPVETAEPPAPPLLVSRVSTRSSQTSKILSARVEPDDEDEEEDRPSRRRSRRTKRDDDDYGGRRSRRGFRCPYCDSERFPITESQISQGGWIMFAVMLVTCWPLFFIGLLMKEDIRKCADCGLKIGG